MAQIEAKVIQILPVATGDKKDGGKWSNQLIVVETFGQYPKTVCLKLGEKLINRFKLGEVMRFHYELNSREYNGKYYTDVNVWKFEAVTQEGVGKIEVPGRYDEGHPVVTSGAVEQNKSTTENRTDSPTGDELPF